MGKNNKLWVVVAGALSLSLNAWAYHPISKKGPHESPYPEYPLVDHGTGTQAALIKRGEYLTKAGDCIACHTDVEGGGKPFAGGLRLETPFGDIYSPNITFDEETGLGKWTEADFVRAMREGRAPDGSNYFPVFPYLYYTKTSDDDLHAIYAYLKSVPKVNQKNKSQPFPFGVPGSRFGVTFWNLMFFRSQQGEYEYNPEKSPEWNRGAYLVDGLGHCSMCHTPLNLAGAPKWDQYLTGAFIEGYWAPNITSYALKNNSIYEVADVFVLGEKLNKAGPMAGPMAEVNHDSLGFLTKADRLAIANYLKTVNTHDPRSPEHRAQQDPLKRGKQVYGNVCAICHNKGKAGAPLISDGPNWTWRMQEQGLNMLYRHTINGYNNMPVKGACVTCSDEDIRAAVDYILNKALTRTEWEIVKKGGHHDAREHERHGKKVYAENCSVCHAQGKLGAPVMGDKARWERIMHKNMDEVIINVLHGKIGVHVQGGCEHCTDSEVIAAIKYMVEQSADKDYSLW